MGERLHQLLRAQLPRFARPGGPLVPPWLAGLLVEALAGHLLLLGWTFLFWTFSGPQARGEADLKHTCDCPRCMVHYETCSQSLMAQVQELRTQNQELQQSHQELSHAVSAAAGISQSYRDRMTQILLTLAKHDEMVLGYQRDSTAVAASVGDHLKMSNGNTAKCPSAVETLAQRYATVASRIDAWELWYATPTETVAMVPPLPSARPAVPEPEPAAPTALMGALSCSSGGGCVLPFSDHPSRDCVCHSNACLGSGWPRWGEEHHEHTYHEEPTSWRGTAECAIPEWRAVPKAKEYPLEPTAPPNGVGGDSSSLGNINPLMKKGFHFPRETFVHAFSSYGHVYSFTSDGCTRCTPNHGFPRVPPLPNACGAR